MVTSSTHNSLMYSKLSHDIPRPRLVLDSNISIVDRNDPADSLPNYTTGNRAEQLLCDHATLLLSIADIAQSEITQCPSALLEDDSKVSIEASHHHRRITPSSLPSFPKQLDGDAYVMESKPNLALLPRHGSCSPRHRSVSFDSPTSVMKNILHPWESTISSATTSPLSLPRAAPKNCRTPRLEDEQQEKVTTPKRSNKSIDQSSHKKARIDSPRLSSIDHSTRNKKLLPPVSTLLSPPRITSSSSPSTNTTTTTSGTIHQALQGTPPIGTTVRKVYRRKFSWKNYPQLEEFLITNREAYLRHSALNYTIEQKNYNNTLTQDLLSLATKNGYIFDTTDFTFVTVRDRIRCYYKSYVQSAKKRGILMGYAAKKAGLLTNPSNRRTSCHKHVNVNDDDDDDDDEELNHNSGSDNDSAD